MAQGDHRNCMRIGRRNGFASIGEGRKHVKCGGLRSNNGSGGRLRVVLFAGDWYSRWKQQGVRREGEEVKDSIRENRKRGKIGCVGCSIGVVVDFLGMS